jgi:3-oxoacid CoA-transferase B subunit
MSDVADQIAQRVAARLPDGAVVNLGIGIPTRVADHLDPARGIVVQTENGLLGVGPAPAPGAEDPTLVNAGKLPVTATVGASYFSSAQSFAMIRGGHVDVAVLGTLEVDARGRIANWSVPGRPILGVGGAMDLLAGARTVLVATTHVTRDGQPKIVEACTLPVTGERAASLIVTEHATFAVEPDGLALVELAPSAELAWVRAHTGAPFAERLGAEAAA